MWVRPHPVEIKEPGHSFEGHEQAEVWVELARYNYAKAKGGGDVSSSQIPTVKQGMMG